MTGYITADTRGQWFVVADDCASLDYAQTSGRWIKAKEPAENRP